MFADSLFWNERHANSLIEGGFVRGLVDAGYSVAVLRHRLGAAGRHPAAAQNVARGVSAILDRGEEEKIYAAAFLNVAARHAASLTERINPDLSAILLLQAARTSPDIPLRRDVMRSERATRISLRSKP